MAYQKLPLRARICAHCADPYQAVDRRRLYCCPSCKTLASNARRRAAGPSLPWEAPRPLAAPEGSEGPAPSLPFDLQTVGVVAVGSALGTLGVRAVDKLLSPASPPPATQAPLGPTPWVAAEREDPASWLPPGLLTAAALLVPLESFSGGPTVVFVQLQYLGHTLYYQPSQRLLLWRAAPGQLQVLHSATEVAWVAEQLPWLEEGTNQAPRLNTSSGLKILG